MSAKRKRKKIEEEKEIPNELDLTKKYRPKNIDEFFGNALLKKSLKQVLKKNSIPHAVLFSGPFGSGKTSLARIFASELNCSPYDLKEIDIADFTGIDLVREIRRKMTTKPFGGSSKVYIMDECFHSDTKIKTPYGNKKIKDFKVGDLVYSLNGVDKVQHVFCNKVSLDRIVKLNFSNGNYLFTTKEHVFYTQNGEVEAINLTKDDLILSFNDDMLQNKTFALEDKNEKITKNKKKILFGLWRKIKKTRERNNQEIQKKKHLLKKLFRKIKSLENWTRTFRKKKMSCLRKNLHAKKIKSCDYLFKDLWKQISRENTNGTK